MINEIKKLYKNVGLDNLWVERYNNDNDIVYENWYPSYKVMIKSMMEKNGWTLTEARNVAKKECHKELLPFTAKKQIELIKWLGKNKNGFGVFNDGTEGLSCHCDFNWEWFRKDFYTEDFDNALAGLINSLWQDLTEEEKQQVKGILE